MRKSHRHPRWTGLLAGPVLAATLLSGCGVAGTEWHPGVAAEVGDEVVTTDRVDEVATDYCTAVSSQVAAEGSAVPLSFFRTGIVGQLALASAAEQLAELYGVEPAGEYPARLQELTDAVADLPEDVRPRRASPSRPPTPTSRASPSPSARSSSATAARPRRPRSARAGTADLRGLAGREPGRLRPPLRDPGGRRGVGPVDDQPVGAVGETAEQGTLQQPDPAYTGRLPSTQRCG